jgi:sec-independent protein translocase protein TatA
MGAGVLQPGHLILVLALVLIIFGPGKLPQLGKSLGDGIREFRRGAESDPTKDTAPDAATAPTDHPPSGSVTPAAGTCRQCGSTVAADARFCGVCGAAQTPAGTTSAP